MYFTLTLRVNQQTYSCAFIISIDISNIMWIVEWSFPLGNVHKAINIQSCDWKFLNGQSLYHVKLNCIIDAFLYIKRCKYK
uniref:Uncharacterized protein n=1 Tax=Pararge aegeria TaxID=116150 RepID=S4P6T1_9NEOP